MKYVISIMLIFSCSIILAQVSKNSKSWHDLKKISNNKITFFISNPTKYVDSSGKVTVKSLVIVEGFQVKKLEGKYGKKIFLDLVNLLNDAERDWAANLLLYNFTKLDAEVIRHYSLDNIEEWRKYRKSKDQQKWREYFKDYR
jgi:hypothetical protein